MRSVRSRVLVSQVSHMGAEQGEGLAPRADSGTRGTLSLQVDCETGYRTESISVRSRARRARRCIR